MDNTKIEAIKLAKVYLSRLKAGEYKNYSAMQYAILHNIVNSEYSNVSNHFIIELWNEIRKQTNY